MNTTQDITKEESPIKTLCAIFQQDEDILEQLEQKDFRVANNNPSERTVVGAYTVPAGQKDKICFTISQERIAGTESESFITSKLSAKIHSPTLGVFVYNHDKVVQGDRGFLADRDGKVADPYIRSVDEFVSEIYRALGTNKVDSFIKEDN